MTLGNKKAASASHTEYDFATQLLPPARKTHLKFLIMHLNRYPVHVDAVSNVKTSPSSKSDLIQVSFSCSGVGVHFIEYY